MYDKAITLVSDRDTLTGKLVATYSGADYTVQVTYHEGASEHTAWNLFEALTQVRTDLERYGLKPALEGACRDVYPSRMALEMGGGRRAQRWSDIGRLATVDIFEDVSTTDYERLSYVTEQQDLGRRHRRRKNG
ncbi:hypothetical protein [Streptomyces xantholiticus]|uniref:hypothetical protein n=1 Tax=Streptomyces xantholiticus TaxID=68285 RepID=UPI001679DEF3|nr:hypothetical protein [Streptomyces xantholiticus]GGW54337.1 hypothetical protein GCM10010381_44820 [Streptomyces xantholiticus]